MQLLIADETYPLSGQLGQLDDDLPAEQDLVDISHVEHIDDATQVRAAALQNRVYLQLVSGEVTTGDGDATRAVQRDPDADGGPLQRAVAEMVGNKQRFAHQIASYFPPSFGTYVEPFLGSGAVLGTLSPSRALASDCFQPLIGIWQTLHDAPETLVTWYTERWELMAQGEKKAVYESIKASYNAAPNSADLLFICRSCYGGVVRFRRSNGFISTPCSIHDPISPAAFSRRVGEWRRRTAGATFERMEYEEAMERAEPGDLVYCDPPYSHSQSILYGAQAFSLERLFAVIARCRARGVYVALSIDGTKRSGDFVCDLPIPGDLFEREMLVNCGRSMLRRFQMQGQTLEGQAVADRLLLTY